MNNKELFKKTESILYNKINNAFEVLDENEKNLFVIDI